VPCFSPIVLPPKRKGDPVWQKVPCNHCSGCFSDRARAWALRCCHELQFHDEACFITLTYRNCDLPFNSDLATLRPEHLQKFWKDLRKDIAKWKGPKIRFYACGEYGETTGRPHYHAIIFGIDFKDKVVFSKSKNLFESPTLNRIWKYGDCKIGEVTYESICYVAGYIGKKLHPDDSQLYLSDGLEKEFSRMSRRPGIGARWWDAFKADLYPHNFAVHNGVKVSVPRYYKNKLKAEDLPAYEKLVEKIMIEMVASYKERSTKRLKVRKEVKESKSKGKFRSFD